MHTLRHYGGEPPRPDYIAEVERSNALEAAFLADHGLSDYRWGPGNIGRILRSGGAPRDAVRAVLRDRFGDGHTIATGFDHARCLGRGGVPLMLIGHPYPDCGVGAGTTPEDWVGPSGLATLAAIRGLGVDAIVLGPDASFYGFGTVHVRVTSREYAPHHARR